MIDIGDVVFGRDVQFFEDLNSAEMEKAVFEPAPELGETGIVLRIITNVEISPLVEVLWSNGAITRCCVDDLEKAHAAG